MRRWQILLGNIGTRHSTFTRRCFSQSLHTKQSNHEKDALYGWVSQLRKQKNVAFAKISDGSTVDPPQAVFDPRDAADLSVGAAVKLTGDWVASSGSKQSHELRVSQVEILGENDAVNTPLQPKFHTAEYLRTIPHLRARISSNALLLRLRSKLIAALTKFFDDQNFVQTHTPIITSSDCEGAGEVFIVSSNTSPSTQDGPFFGAPKYLTVSAQLHLEALAQSVSKVWTLSPTFRAEESDTPRHLSEFYMLEAEVCFTDNLSDILALVESMLRSAVADLQRTMVFKELLSSEPFAPSKTIQDRWNGILAEDWPRITYADAIRILEKAGDVTFEHRPTYEDGLFTEHERYLASLYQGKPVFVTEYPRSQKPFYMLPSAPAGSDDTVACFDLLVPDLCELVGGSLREHRSDRLLETMRAKSVAGSNLDWYRDLRKFGSVPHGGFGLGFDRLLCYLSGVSNLRDVVAFPRWPGRADC